jgi:hypothetical protein
MKRAKDSPARFWTPAKIRFFSIAVITLVLLHMAWVFMADTHDQSMLRRGDFPAFYAAGMIARQGMAHQIYDPLLLEAVQNLYWPSFQGRFILFPYAPFAAFFLMPLAYFPPLAAKGIFVLLMTGCLAVAARWTAAHAPVLNKNALALSAFLLAFFPLNFSVAGGQNTALSMMLNAGVLYFFGKNDRRADWIAGLCLGLWLFKPQFGVFIGAMFLLAGFYRVAAGAAGVGLLYYLLSAGMTGRDWLLKWIDVLQIYMAYEAKFNFFNMISLHGFLDAAAKTIRAGESTASFLNFLSFVLSLLLLAALFFLSFRLQRKETAFRRYDFLRLLRIAMPVILLASPHTLFYDSSIALVALAPYVRLENDRKVWILILMTAAASAAVSFRSRFPLPPLFFGLVWAAVFVVRQETAVILQRPPIKSGPSR